MPDHPVCMPRNGLILLPIRDQYWNTHGWYGNSIRQVLRVYVPYVGPTGTHSGAFLDTRLHPGYLCAHLGLIRDWSGFSTALVWEQFVSVCDSAG